MTGGADDFWVFAYGSLMWNPGFDVAERRHGRIYGYHRALCVKSWRYRGTPVNPGLVLGLDRGGSCRGIGLRVSGRIRRQVMAYLDERELSDNVYHETRVRLHLEAEYGQAPEAVTALAYVARHDTPQYRAETPLAETLTMVRQGRGERGACIDYVRSTVAHLRESGVRDKGLERVLHAHDQGQM